MPLPNTDPTQWFKDEVHVHDGQLKSWLRGQFPSVRDVDDVVQESYLRIWKARLTAPVRSAKSFLFQVARHVAIDLLRRERASPVVQLGDLAGLSVMDSRPDSAQALGAKERLDLLSDALVALPPRCRQIIMLHKIQGMSQRQVAERLGLSERTVENHTRAGIVRLQLYMSGRGVQGFSVD